MSKRMLAKSARKSKRKYPKWQDIETLGCVMSMVKLPDANINGSKQYRNDWHAQLKLKYDKHFLVLANDHISLKDKNAKVL